MVMIFLPLRRTSFLIVKFINSLHWRIIGFRNKVSELKSIHPISFYLLFLILCGISRERKLSAKVFYWSQSCASSLFSGAKNKLHHFCGKSVTFNVRSRTFLGFATLQLQFHFQFGSKYSSMSEFLLPKHRLQGARGVRPSAQYPHC